MNNVPVINAIPTEYRGTTFRSRTEARWAVFLDELDIRWQYEAEGYQLSAGWYVPDFWLTEFEFFVEVKPSNTQGRDKAIDLGKTVGRNVVVTHGAPESSLANTRLFAPISDIYRDALQADLADLQRLGRDHWPDRYDYLVTTLGNGYTEAVYPIGDLFDEYIHGAHLADERVLMSAAGVAGRYPFWRR